MKSEIFGEPISIYSRADALRDGALVEVPADLRREAGILYPVAVTDHLWSSYIEPDNLAEMPGQSVDGRLWDLLWLFRCASRRGSGARIKYHITVLTKTAGTRARMKTITVIAVCGPGDYGEPVLTLMLPEDD